MLDLEPNLQSEELKPSPSNLMEMQTSFSMGESSSSPELASPSMNSAISIRDMLQNLGLDDDDCDNVYSALERMMSENVGRFNHTVSQRHGIEYGKQPLCTRDEGKIYIEGETSRCSTKSDLNNISCHKLPSNMTVALEHF